MGWTLNASPAVNAESDYPSIITICVVLTVLSLIIVLTRLRIRYKARGFAADDYLAALSELFVILYAALCIAQTRYGLGLPPKDRPVEDLDTYTKLNFAGRPIYQLGISFFKIALLVSYLRLLEGSTYKYYRWTVWTIIVIVFAAHLGCTLSLIFACDPVYKSWEPQVTGTCIAPGPSFTGYAIVTIVSDITVALVPIPVLLKLNVHTGRKLGLVGIFALGLFTTVCSILRYLQINRIQYGDGNSTMLVLWGVIEFNVGNIVSSLPFLAPVFIRKAKAYRSKQSAGYGVSSGDRKSRRKGEKYQLSSMSKGTPENTVQRTDSQEKILSQMAANGSIIKSVTYEVHVDEHPDEGHSMTSV